MWWFLHVAYLRLCIWNSVIVDFLRKAFLFKTTFFKNIWDPLEKPYTLCSDWTEEGGKIDCMTLLPYYVDKLGGLAFSSKCIDCVLFDYGFSKWHFHKAKLSAFEVQVTITSRFLAICLDQSMVLFSAENPYPYRHSSQDVYLSVYKSHFHVSNVGEFSVGRTGIYTYPERGLGFWKILLSKWPDINH